MKKDLVPVVLFLALLLGGQLSAQHITENPDKPARLRKNAVYLEILGSGAVYSFNYDRLFPLKKPAALVVRIGGNEYHGASTDKNSYNLLGSVGLIRGAGRHFFEPSLGFTYFSGSADRLTVLSLGYRYQGRRGLLLRATPMYISNSEKGDTFGNSPWFGMSVGYSF